MKILKNIKNYYIIRKSNFFDESWFKNNYNLQEGFNPIKYYLKYGIEKGLNPSRYFDTLWYLKEFPDVNINGMHPFVHYILHGAEEHRLSMPLFVKNDDKFSLENHDYNLCFFNKNEYIDVNDVNVAIFIKNGLENLLPTEYVRLIIPFYHLFLEKNFKPYIFNNDSNEFSEENFKKFDVVIVQRDAIDENTAKCIVKMCKIYNIKLIYELDDDLLKIDKNHPNFDEFVGKKSLIKYLISNSDMVTVSTDYLKKKLISFNPKVVVIKNSLNDMLCLNNNSFGSDTIKIGYMGTLTHKHDVKIIEKVIDDVKKYFSKKGKTVIFETIGVSDEKIDCAIPINIPFKYSKYPYFIRWLKRVVDWDIALAPLENNEFNKSKSEIKYLEYTSLGIPGIYSNIGAYSNVIENNKTGILIDEDNSVDEWYSAIIDLIENDYLRKNIVKNAKIDVNNNYSIDSMVNSWIDIFNEVLTNDKLEIFNKNPLKLLVNPIFNQEYFGVVESNLFKRDEYPVVNHDPVYHFLTVGVFKGYNPSNEFDCKKYSEIKGINMGEVNPFVHFIEKHVLKFNNVLSNENIEDICQNLKRKVSIIIPIW